ncbi:tail protein with endopeptidase activity [Lactobacillus phage ATCC8014]|uniref:Prophage tail super family protein n=1 Tax=Lactobacillus phage ATCC8014 TaxID=2892340 RepID=K4ICZ3_9CAUD|nr:tail protein with endopeptidase activity [Lactobacillus phage ATCC8014]AFU63024.1 prophage tail super family protein [Lactobacillus phage ATCC8014]
MYVIAFKDVSNHELLADATITTKNGVNGEKSLSGVVYFGDGVKNGLAKGWTLTFNDEQYVVMTFKRNDSDNTVSFTAIEMFFYRFGSLSFYETWNGSHTFKQYLDALFKDTGYTYTNSADVAAFTKENWGMKTKIELFNDIIKQAGVEFKVLGKTVVIQPSIGSDLATVVRLGFNLKDAEIEEDNSSFATYGRGYGVYSDPNDTSSSRLSVEYYSPLYDQYKDKFGKIEAVPVDDQRFTVAANLLAEVKNRVDSSFSVSLTLNLIDLQNAGYPYAMAHPGDTITVVDEKLDYSSKVRITEVNSTYAINGNRVGITVSVGDKTMASSSGSKNASVIDTIGEVVNGNRPLDDAWFSERMLDATNAILDTQTELKFTRLGIIAVEKNNKNNMLILNSSGIGISNDGGQTFRTAITANAIDGQVINIKNLNAANIVAGKISGKDLSIDLDTGKVQFEHGLMQSSSGSFKINVDTGEVLFTHGIIKGQSMSIDLDMGKVHFSSGSIVGESSNGSSISLNMDTAILQSFNKRNEGFEVGDGRFDFYSDFFGSQKKKIASLYNNTFSDNAMGLTIDGANGIDTEAGVGTSTPARLVVGQGLNSAKGHVYAYGSQGVLIEGGNYETINMTPGEGTNYGSISSGKFALLGKGGMISTALANANLDIAAGAKLELSGTKEVRLQSKNTNVWGNLAVTGNKNAITPTRDGVRQTPAYEMAESYFGDIGETVTGDDCRVKVPIDVIFGDIVNTNYKYQVFLQSYSSAHVWVAERHDEYFIVESDQPNAPVAWELKARRRGHEQERLLKADIGFKAFDDTLDFDEEHKKKVLERQEELNNDSKNL